MIIPVNRTAVIKHSVPLLLQEWGHTIYFIHHFEAGRYLMLGVEGLRVYYQSEECSWSDIYFELVEE